MPDVNRAKNERGLSETTNLSEAIRLTKNWYLNCEA